MGDDDFAGLNFWPAFADFMLALLLVFLIAYGIAAGGVNPYAALECQKSLEEKFRQAWPRLGPEQVEFGHDKDDPFLLRVCFQDQVLFDSDDARLKPEGEETLRSLAGSIKLQLQAIREIQIHGHADTRRSRRFRSNLHLAAERANSVFQLLQSCGISAADHAMSATSYGEYFPVNRRLGEEWNIERIAGENSSDGLQRRNRRVELRLFYGENAPECR